MGIFRRIALFLYQKICRLNLPIPGIGGVEKDLVRLHPGRNKEDLCKDYYVKKISLVLLICVLGGILTGIVMIQEERNRILQEDGSVYRGDFREGAKELTVAATYEDGTKEEFQIAIEAVELTEAEQEELYTKFALELPDLIMGENQSLEKVSNSLQLLDCYEGYPFTLEWKSSQPGIINSSGEIGTVEEETKLLLTAKIYYKEREWKEELAVCVIPPVLTKEEQHHRDVATFLQASEENGRTQNIWEIPKTYQGQSIVWEEVVSEHSIFFLFAAFVVAGLLFVLSDKDLHASLEKQKEGMKRAYPDIVQKLVLYLGAGLTIRGAFQKMAAEYEEERHRGKKEEPIYEEILFACREIQSGVSEGKAYEHLGRRTGVQEYIRLGTLLAQNLKKGNSTLLLRLREEAQKSYVERLQNSRKLGEEAGTKLLLPMVLILMVVMLLIMIPAFSSTGI